MRADRLIQLVLLLQTHGKMTATDLARRVEVSPRTVQRDLDALSAAGVPVYADRGRGGGWSLARDYRTRLDGLNPTESAALFVGTTGHVLADLGLNAAADIALTKLLAAIPAGARRDADRARERVLVDHDDWTGGRDAEPWLQVARQALWNDQRMVLAYGSAAAPITVEPLGLVAKKRAWYLVAARADGQLRTYRVDRIRSAEVTDETFVRPDSFDLAEYWRRTNSDYFASLRDYPVRLRVRGTVGHRLRWAPNAVIDNAAERDDGWWDVDMTFEKADEARIVLLGLSGNVVVIEPAELRTEMIAAARSLLAAHAPARSMPDIT